jgi:flagellar hook-basal body complex protein FliE
MSLLGITSAISPQTLRPPVELTPIRPETAAPAAPLQGPSSFGSVFENMISGVEASQANAASVTRSVLLGENPNLHQSVIAMQEASLSFSLMVEVRNKVIESYQELMRLPV